MSAGNPLIGRERSPFGHGSPILGKGRPSQHGDSGSSGLPVENIELREDGGDELREDRGMELREDAPAGYVAKAVHFNGAAHLRNGSLIATDTSVFSYSIWCKYASPAGGPTLFVVDPENNYTSNASFGGVNQVPPHVLRSTLFDVTGGSPTVDANATAATDDNIWHHILYSAQTNQAPGSNVVKFFVDDVDVTHVWADVDTPFTMIFNGLSFWVGWDGYHAPLDVYEGDFADLWFAPNVSLLSGGTIPEANRRKFISASKKPVDPINFPVGAILFSGDHTTFPNNQGTGGAFTLTGALTNATTSPSD